MLVIKRPNNRCSAGGSELRITCLKVLEEYTCNLHVINCFRKEGESVPLVVK